MSGKIKKWKKILLWIVCPVLVVGITFMLTINTIIRHILTDKVDKAIERTDSLQISYDKIDVDIFTGRMWIYDVEFQTDKLPADSFRAFSSMHVSLVKLEGVNYKSLLYDREIDLTGLLIRGVSYKGILDTKAMAAREMANAINEEQMRQLREVLREAQKYLKRVTLRRLSVEKATADIKALETGLHVNIEETNMAFFNLGYNLRENVPFHFNDSLMHMNIKNLDVTMPDSLMHLSVASVISTPDERGMVVTGIRFATDSIRRETEMYHEAYVDTFRFEDIIVPDMKRKRSLTVQSIELINCDYYGCIDDTKKKKGEKKKVTINDIDFDNLGLQTKEAQLLAKWEQKQEEIMTTQKKRLLELVQTWLDEVDLEHFAVRNTNIHLKSYKSALDVDAHDINIEFNNLSYSLEKKQPFDFNKNVYIIEIGKTCVTFPDGIMKLESNGFSHKNCGPICVGKSRVYNTVDKWRLAHIKGDVSSTWIDITLDTFHTTAFNPFKTVYKGQLKMDSVTAIVGDMHLFVDNRNLTIKEFNIPSQKALMEIKRLLNVGVIKVGVNNMKTELTGPYANPGYVTMRNAMVAFSDTMFKEINVDDFVFKFPDSDMRLEIGEIHTNRQVKGLVVKDVTFKTSNEYEVGEQFHDIDIDSIVIEGIMLPNFRDNADIGAACLRIVHPVYTAYIDEKPEKKKRDESFDQVSVMEQRRKEYKKAQLKNTMKVMQELLENAQLQRIKIDDADVDVRSIRSGFSIKTKDLYAHFNGMKVNLEHFMPMNLNDSAAKFDPIRNNFKMLGNNVITYLALKNLHATLPDSSMYLNIKRISTDRQFHSLIISGVEFATDTLVPEDEMYHDARIDSIRLDGIILPDLKGQKEASLSSLRVINACYYGQINEKRKKAKKKESINGFEVDGEPVEEEMTEEEKRKSLKHERAMSVISNWFEGASLDAVSIENASAKVKSITSNLNAEVTGINFRLNDISYAIDNVKSLNFNDSVYYFGIEHIDLLLPDSSMVMEINNLEHANRGSFSLGKTRMLNTIDKWEIAHTKGDVPSTWMKMVIDTVHTSGINPVRIIKNAGKVRLDSLTAVIDTMYVFRDIRYKPVKPYSMLQKPLMNMPDNIKDMFTLNVADATINQMEIVLPKTDSCIMVMAMQDLHGLVHNIDLREGNTISVEGDAHWGGGTAHVDMDIPLRPEYPWNFSLVARDIDMHCMDSLVFPIAALRIGGKINEMKAIVSGDSVNAHGYLSLAYEDLDIRFCKGSPTPIKFLRNNTKFLTGVARAFVTKRNPLLKGHLPLAYEAKSVNNVWQPSAMFMMGPIIKGSVETLLPGLFVHKRVSQDKLIIKHKFKEE